MGEAEPAHGIQDDWHTPPTPPLHPCPELVELVLAPQAAFQATVETDGDGDLITGLAGTYGGGTASGSSSGGALLDWHCGFLLVRVGHGGHDMNGQNSALVFPFYVNLHPGQNDLGYL